MTALSARNPRVLQLRRLVRERKIRTETGLFVLEGPGLVAEALNAGAEVRDLVVASGADVDRRLLADAADAGVAVWEVDARALESIASTKTPQPVIATVSDVTVDLDEAIDDDTSFVVVGAAIGEPGNAGTIIRTAAAAGADAVVFCAGSVDVTNPKVVRSTAGSLFRVPVVRDADTAALFGALRDRGIATVGLLGAAADRYDELDYTAPTAIVLGNEAHGVPASVAARLDRTVSIPMERGVESVNVAAAAAAVAFEAARQRRSGGPGPATAQDRAD